MIETKATHTTGSERTIAHSYGIIAFYGVKSRWYEFLLTTANPPNKSKAPAPDALPDESGAVVRVKTSKSRSGAHNSKAPQYAAVTADPAQT